MDRFFYYYYFTFISNDVYKLRRIEMIETARNFKMPFGKFKGETLEEIYIQNPDYLDWVLDTLSDEQEALKQKVRECQKEMRKVQIY